MSINNQQVLLADTEPGRMIHYRMRFEVYCVQTGFEEASKFPDKQEKDEFDCRSKHFLAHNKRSGDWLGTTRLILPCEEPLPIQRHCKLNTHVALDQIAEVSRLLIANPAQRWREVAQPNAAQNLTTRTQSHHVPKEPHKRSNILKDLISALAGYCVDHDIPYTAFFITPALARILRRLKISLLEFGSPCEHRGLRIPYIADMYEVYKTLCRPFGCDGIGYLPASPYGIFSELYGTANSHDYEEQIMEKSGT